MKKKVFYILVLSCIITFFLVTELGVKNRLANEDVTLTEQTQELQTASPPPSPKAQLAKKDFEIAQKYAVFFGIVFIIIVSIFYVQAFSTKVEQGNNQEATNKKSDEQDNTGKLNPNAT